MSFIFAVTMRVYMRAALSPPGSDPAKSHDFLPNAIPLRAHSAALFVRPNGGDGRYQRPTKLE
jgi:hypothetical protein